MPRASLNLFMQVPAKKQVWIMQPANFKRQPAPAAGSRWRKRGDEAREKKIKLNNDHYVFKRLGWLGWSGATSEGRSCLQGGLWWFLFSLFVMVKAPGSEKWVNAIGMKFNSTKPISFPVIAAGYFSSGASLRLTLRARPKSHARSRAAVQPLTLLDRNQGYPLPRSACAAAALLKTGHRQAGGFARVVTLQWQKSSIF
jgi:hypothetical protein